MAKMVYATTFANANGAYPDPDTPDNTIYADGYEWRLVSSVIDRGISTRILWFWERRVRD